MMNKRRRVGPGFDAVYPYDKPSSEIPPPYVNKQEGLHDHPAGMLAVNIAPPLTFTRRGAVGITVGDGLDTNEGLLKASIAKGLEFTDTGLIQVKPGSGLAFDESGALTAEAEEITAVTPLKNTNGQLSLKLGSGITLDQEGNLTLNIGEGLVINAAGTLLTIPLNFTPPLNIADSTISLNLGTGLTIQDSQLSAKLGAGLVYDTASNISVNVGKGLVLNAQGQIDIDQNYLSGITLWTGLDPLPNIVLEGDETPNMQMFLMLQRTGAMVVGSCTFKGINKFTTVEPNTSNIEILLTFSARGQILYGYGFLGKWGRKKGIKVDANISPFGRLCMPNLVQYKPGNCTVGRSFTTRIGLDTTAQGFKALNRVDMQVELNKKKNAQFSICFLFSGFKSLGGPVNFITDLITFTYVGDNL